MPKCILKDNLLVLQRCFWGKRIPLSSKFGKHICCLLLRVMKQNWYSKVSEKSWSKETFWLQSFLDLLEHRTLSSEKGLLTRFLGIHISKPALIPSIYFIEEETEIQRLNIRFKGTEQLSDWIKKSNLL